MAKRLLERYEWWRFEPHPKWVEPHWSADNYVLPYAAGIPGQVRIIFIPVVRLRPTVTHLESGVRYRAFYFDPSIGREYDLGVIQADEGGCWRAPKPPILRDWLLVLEQAD